MRVRQMACAVLAVIGSCGTMAVAADATPGKYLPGQYNVGQQDGVRYFACVTEGQLTYQNAQQAADRTAQMVSRGNTTHERLWDGNYREVALDGNHILVVGFVDVNTGRFGFLATDVFRNWISNSHGGVDDGWTRQHWQLARGARVYLQVGHNSGRVQYQFDAN
jgi:hypothetical protein